jgi:hypothetical protein
MMKLCSRGMSPDEPANFIVDEKAMVWGETSNRVWVLTT